MLLYIAHLCCLSPSAHLFHSSTQTVRTSCLFTDALIVVLNFHSASSKSAKSQISRRLTYPYTRQQVSYNIPSVKSRYPLELGCKFRSREQHGGLFLNTGRHSLQTTEHKGEWQPGASFNNAALLGSFIVRTWSTPITACCINTQDCQSLGRQSLDL